MVQKSAKLPAKPATQRRYPRSYLLAFLGPFSLATSAVLSNMVTETASNIFMIVCAIISVAVFFHQMRAFLPSAERRRIAVLELALVVAGTILVSGAGYIGDVQGAIKFSDPDGTTSTLLGTIGFTCGLAAVYMSLFAIINLLHMSILRPHKIFRILGIIGYCLLWIITCLVAYLSYGFAYSAHDPDAE